MRLICRLIRRLLYVFRQRREAAELAEEMEIHRQMVEQETGDGSAARRRMGATLMAQEESRSVWLASWIESIFQDLRYAWCSLRNQPSFTMLALLALVLAIGLDTSLFTFFNAIAIRPWPVPDPDRVVTLFASSSTRARPGGFSVAEYGYFREHSRTLSGAFIMRHERVNLDRQAEGARSACHFVSGEYFSALNVEMALGRGFADDEDRLENPQGVAVLSYRTWQSRYAADPKILGRKVEVNDVPFTVVGVAHEEFTGTVPGPSDLWVPLSALQLALPNDSSWKDFLSSPDHCCSQLAGRMVPGTTRQKVQAELTLLDAQFQAQRREKPQNIIVAGTAFLSNPSGKRVAGQVVSLLAAAVGAILLLACANVSNLMLARASARQREIAVRLAIGAGRWRVVRQLLTESLLLASIASVLGLAVAAWLPRFLLTRMTDEAPPFRLAPDGTVLAFSVAITFVVTMAFGLVPALRATQISVSEAMKNHNALAGGRFPLRSFLLGVQVTISVVLLAAAGLLARGLVHARQVDPGFQTSGVALVPVDIPTSTYNRARGEVFFKDLQERLRPLSPSGKVGLSMLAPLGTGRMAEGLQLPGQTSGSPTSVLYYRVNAEFFDVLQIPVLVGRNFSPADAAGRVIIINDTMARRYWPGQNPLGKVVGNNEIVGVVGDAQLSGLGPVDPVFFRPFAGGQRGVFVLNGNADDRRWAGRIAAAARQQEARATVGVVSLAQQMDRWLGSSRVGAALAAALGGLALLLAAVGVYGVVTYSVERRRREIGVRMALGARPSQIVAYVARSNSRALLIGLALGLVASLGVSKLLESSLFGASRLDPLAYGGVLLVLFTAGMVASIVPARRAAGIAPLEALHYE